MYKMNTKSTFPIDIGFIDLLMRVNFDNRFDSNWIKDLDIIKTF